MPRRLTFSLLTFVTMLPFSAAAEDKANQIPGFAIELFRNLLEEFGPDAQELRERLGDFPGYHLPEILPNGDILIRRKEPDETLPPPKDGQIDL